MVVVGVDTKLITLHWRLSSFWGVLIDLSPCGVITPCFARRWLRLAGTGLSCASDLCHWITLNAENHHISFGNTVRVLFICVHVYFFFLIIQKLFADSWGDEYFIKHNFMNFHRTSPICILLSFKLQFIIGVGWSISLNVIACCKISLYQSKLCGQLNEVSLFLMWTCHKVK